MKRITLVAFIALCLSPSLIHAFPFSTPLRFLPRPLLAEGEAERVNRPPLQGANLDFVLSTFSKPIIGKFREAWQRAGNGTSPRESVVLILRMNDGSYSARLPNPTNEYKSFTFAWNPATIAIVHTHPTSSPPRPEDGDIITANKCNVPVFTITSRGMFVYDPATRKITQVLDGLQWGEEAAWEKVHTHLARR
ncbi:MAG: hypothetical protein ACJ74J_15695 [Blastocatellia bacterium]